MEDRETFRRCGGTGGQAQLQLQPAEGNFDVTATFRVHISARSTTPTDCMSGEAAPTVETALELAPAGAGATGSP